MTAKQTYLYFDLWRKAAAALGVKASDNDRRHAETLAALGYRKSSKLFDNPEFDRVKRHLIALAQPLNLQAQIDVDHPEDEQRKRLLWRINRIKVPRALKERIREFQYASVPLEKMSLHALNRYRVGLIEEERKLARQEIRRAKSVPKDAILVKGVDLPGVPDGVYRLEEPVEMPF